MSTQYKKPSEVPNEVLAHRLDQLGMAVLAKMHGNEGKFSSEYTCRIPCELDRDADVVLLEAARRLRALCKK